jgi:hypothetical protein
MNQHEMNTPTNVEDLTVNEEKAEEVKGGAQVPFYLKLQGVDGDVASTRQSAPSISEVVVTKDLD